MNGQTGNQTNPLTGHQCLPGLVGEVVGHHAVTGFKQRAADDATLAFGPLLPLWVLLTGVGHYLRGVAELRVHLPTVCKGRDIDWEATLGGREVISLVTVKVTTETFHLVRISIYRLLINLITS